MEDTPALAAAVRVREPLWRLLRAGRTAQCHAAGGCIGTIDVDFHATPTRWKVSGRQQEKLSLETVIGKPCRLLCLFEIRRFRTKGTACPCPRDRRGVSGLLRKAPKLLYSGSLWPLCLRAAASNTNPTSGRFRVRSRPPADACQCGSCHRLGPNGNGRHAPIATQTSHSPERESRVPPQCCSAGGHEKECTTDHSEHNGERSALICEEPPQEGCTARRGVRSKAGTTGGTRRRVTRPHTLPTRKGLPLFSGI